MKTKIQARTESPADNKKTTHSSSQELKAGQKMGIRLKYQRIQRIAGVYIDFIAI